MATDYHQRPVLSVRVDADLKEFAVAEAKRPGMTLGDVVGDALADLRAKRTVNHVVDPVPVAAGDEQPQQAGQHCTHRNMRISKGICPDCHQPAGYREGQG